MNGEINVNKTAIVLGGTVPHCELIKQLKQRGYYTILVDYNDDPPAKEFADEHIKESTLDKEQVLKIASDRCASLVISTCVDQANVVCCYVAEKLGLPHPYSYESSLDVTDKSRMKKIMLEHGIQTSQYVTVGMDDKTAADKLSYPLMIKPSDSNSANGVKKVYNKEQLDQYLPQAFKISRNGLAIVEEFMEGTEFSAYCVVIDNKAKLLMVQERISVIEGSEQTIKCYASVAPARFDDEVTKEIEVTATKIANAFGLDNTPLFFQGIYDGSELSVIEFAPRVGGGISSQTIKLATGYDIIKAAIDSFLGIKINVEGWHIMQKVYAVNQIYGTDGIYDKTVISESIKNSDDMELLYFYKKSGALIDEKRASSSRIGVFLASGESMTEVRKKIKRVFDATMVYDRNGMTMMRKDLNLYDMLA